MFLGTVFLIFAVIAYVIAFIELIVAIVLLVNKKKTPAIVLFILSAIPGVVTLAFIIWFSITTNLPSYDTPDGGTVTVAMHDVQEMKLYIADRNMEGLSGYLDKHPELIYYQDTNHITLLEYALRNCDVELMEVAYDHGARFDDKAAHKNLVYDYSLQVFLRDLGYDVFARGIVDTDTDRFTPGVTTDEIIETARFALEHGARAEWNTNHGYGTFANTVEDWIGIDGEISAKDEELLRLAKNAL